MTDPVTGLTPGTARDLARARAWRDERGADPTPRQWAKEFRMHLESADAALCRLAAAGYLSPRRPHRYDDAGDSSPVEAENRRLIAALRDADAILSAVTVYDRAARDAWRRRWDEYLVRPLEFDALTWRRLRAEGDRAARAAELETPRRQRELTRTTEAGR